MKDKEKYIRQLYKDLTRMYRYSMGTTSLYEFSKGMRQEKKGDGGEA